MTLRLREAVGLALLCLLIGSRWLVESAYPTGLPSLLQQALDLAVPSLFTLPFCIGRRFPPAWRRIVPASVLAIGLPALLGDRAGSVAALSGTALTAMAPLFIVIFSAALGQERRSMAPALAGLAGGLMLLPFQLPSTLAGVSQMVLFVLAVMLAAAASVWTHRLLASVDLPAAVCTICLPNALLLALASLLRHQTLAPHPLQGELPRLLLISLPATLLLVWLWRALPPVRLASRYLITPLITVAEGAALQHPSIDLRRGAGIALLLIAGALLFAAADEDAGPALPLLS